MSGFVFLDLPLDVLDSWPSAGAERAFEAQAGGSAASAGGRGDRRLFGVKPCCLLQFNPRAVDSGTQVPRKCRSTSTEIADLENLRHPLKWPRRNTAKA